MQHLATSLDAYNSLYCACPLVLFAQAQVHVPALELDDILNEAKTASDAALAADRGSVVRPSSMHRLASDLCLLHMHLTPYMHRCACRPTKRTGRTRPESALRNCSI